MPLSEPEKVSQLVRALEDQLAGDLYSGSDQHRVGSIRVERKGFGTAFGRPDVVVWVELEMHVLGVRTLLRVPILVEAEDAGWYAAKEDYELFFEREKLDIPMVVVGKPGAKKEKHDESAKANVRVRIHQIGFDRLSKT